MSDIHALLVGIDRYEPERLPDGRSIPPLAGAVNDVLRFRRFLEEGPFGVRPERIRQLVSPLSWVDPAPASDGPPTRASLIREIRALGERAAPGDQVLIHFSGHGARLPTAVPEVKGRGARDECLALQDVGADGGGFLRDIELHALLGELTARDRFVTLIADCCHSGGIARTPATARVRGLGDLPFPPPPASPLGPWSALAPPSPAETGAAKPSTRMRRLRPHAGPLPVPEGCTLLAACLPTELAHEAPFEGAFGGLLTRHLLRVLGELRRAATYREVHHRLRVRFRDGSMPQTPTLRGDGDRVVLTGARRPSATADGAGGPGAAPVPLPIPGRRAAEASATDLAAAIGSELFGLERIESWWLSGERRAVDPSNVPVGALLCLLLHNRSERELEVAVLDHRSDGAVERLHPFPGHGDSSPLAPGGEQPVFLRAELPEEAEEGRDRIEILIATEPMAFDPLEPGTGTSAHEPCTASRTLALRIRRPPALPVEPWWTTGD